MTVVTALRIIGIVLATYLFIRFFGVPFGLIAGAALAMLFLP